MATTAVESNRPSTIDRAQEVGSACGHSGFLTPLSQKINILAKGAFALLTIGLAATLVLTEMVVFLIPWSTTILFLPQAIYSHIKCHRIRGGGAEDQRMRQKLWENARSAYVRAIPIIGNGIVVLSLSRSLILGACCPL